MSARAVLALTVVVVAAVGFAVMPALRSDGAAGVEAPRRLEGPTGALPAGPASAGPDASPRVQSSPAPGSAGTAAPAAGAAGSAASPAASVLVHVVGQVARPGVVTLPGGSRVADALAAVGGPTPEADLAAVNLARLLVDGEQVRVPAPGEVLGPPPAGPGEVGAGGAASEGGGAAALLDLNTATESQLDGLPGVGPVLAGRIVAWRTANGTFRSVEELQEVSGIGDRTYAEIAPLVRV